jgi:hypothetical protein
MSVFCGTCTSLYNSCLLYILATYGANSVIYVDILCWFRGRQEEKHINVIYLRIRICHTSTNRHSTNKNHIYRYSWPHGIFYDMLGTVLVR